MNAWGLEPIGGPWWVGSAAVLLLLVLLAAPTGARLGARRRRTLIALRAATALLLLFAMLRPTHVTTQVRRVPGTLILLVDSSRSMQVTDSIGNVSRWETLKDVLHKSSDHLEELAEAWDVRFYRFDSEVTPLELKQGRLLLAEQPEGLQTAIGSSLDDVLQRESDNRIVAVFLLGDGAQRAFAPRDMAPQTAVRRLAADGIPFNTVTFGQPALGLQSDLRISDLLVADTTFAGAPLTVRAVVGATGYANRTCKVQLLWENAEGKMEVVDTRPLTIQNEQRQISVSLSHTPIEPGQYKVSLRVESPEGEMVTTNNQQSTFVTVRKGGIKVLYLTGAARLGGGPGIEPRFIREALDAHNDIDLRFDLLDYRKLRLNFRDWLREEKYDVYLLGNVDATALSTASWKQIADDIEQGAGLAMLGGFHSFGPGGFYRSPLGDVLPIVLGRAERQGFSDPIRQDMHLVGPIGMVPEEGRRHPIMQIHLKENSTEQENRAAWQKMPKLDGANRFDRHRLKPNAQIVARANDSSRSPLLVTGAWGEGRTIALAIDSTWRWRMEDFSDAQRRFWRQLILWLARKDATQDETVWVRLDQRRALRGSHAAFTLGANDADGQPLSSATFKVTIQRPDGTIDSVRPNLRGTTQVGRSGELEQPGDYRVQIAAHNGDQLVGTAEARFLVPDDDMELDQPAAEPTFMASLANLTTEGEAIAPEQFSDLLKRLKKRTKEFEEEVLERITLWDKWPLLLLLVALLSCEWWLRKRWGLV